jgi:hypothetical protein
MLIAVPNRPVAAALAACVALAGCSLGGDDEPEPIAGSPKAIAEAIGALERASRDRDWAAICDELFSAAARDRAGGRDCARLLRETAGDVRRPEIRLLSIELERERARARVRTRSAGQAPAEDTVVLVREGGEWKIDALTAG